MDSSPVSLISQWFIKPGCETDAFAALKSLAQAVKDGDPDTLAYLVHSSMSDPRLQSLPPADASTLLFFESYRSADAFLAHVQGPIFQEFLSAHGDLFLQAAGKPYTTVLFLERQAGFVRGIAADEASSEA